MTYNALSDSDEPESKNLGTNTRNPFHYLRPVRPHEFLGRWPLVEEIALDLTLEDGDSHACIGGRRCGKSSLLAALHYYLTRTKTVLGDHILLPILLDLKKYNFAIESDFFAALLQEVLKQLRLNVSKSVESSWGLNSMLDRVRLESFTTSNLSNLSLTRFEEALNYIMDTLDESGGPSRLVILIDEIDDALRYSWSQVLFGQIRSLVYAGALADRVRIVVTGSRRILDEVTDHGSPLWNVLKVHFLYTFDEATTYQLMGRAVGLAKVAQEAVWHQSGGHPFLAQYLLHHIWSQNITQVSQFTIEQVADRFLHEEQVHLEGWAKAIEAVGLLVYEHFADQVGWIDELSLIRTLGDPNVPIKRSLTALCYHGLIIHDGHWRCYRCAGMLFRNWYMQEGRFYLSTLTHGKSQSQYSIVSTRGKEKHMGPIRILFLAANPVNTDRLRLDEEVRTIDERLRASQFRDRFELIQHWALRHSDVSEYLLRHTPHIVHFSGHGSSQGAIMLEDKNGKATAVAPEMLGRLFRTLKDNVQCVVLNACFSATQADAIIREIDCVLGMSRAIGDEAAIQFASGFYRALGYGRSVQTAFDLGCSEIDLAGLGEEDTPKLMVKSGVQASDMMLIEYD